MTCRQALPGLALVLLTLGTGRPAWGHHCERVFPQARATSTTIFIRVMPGGNNLNMANGTALNQAMDQWNSTCGSKIPTLSKTRPSIVSFDVDFFSGAPSPAQISNPDACGTSSISPPATQLGSGTILIFERTRNGTDCTGNYTEAIAHELGHLLGLDHSPCTDNIMTPAIADTPQGLRPKADDCAAVDEFWMTPAEVPPAPICDCSVPSDCGPPPDEFATWECRACQCVPTNSPLVLYLPDYLALGGASQTWWMRGFCSAEAPTVCLDWRGDGSVTCTAWTEPGSEVAFVVALDAGDVVRLAAGDAVISEPWRHLFGNVTRGPRGNFPYAHGFEALAAHCGVDADAIEKLDFTECGATLHVWNDGDGDGRIALEELLRFPELGVESLTDVGRTEKTDRCGNTFPAESHATCSGDLGHGKCGIWLDVFFEAR